MLRGVYAIKALRFSTALSVLKDEFLRSRDYPRCPPTSHLFHRFRQLGYACIKYADKEILFVLISYAVKSNLVIASLYKLIALILFFFTLLPYTYSL